MCVCFQKGSDEVIEQIGANNAGVEQMRDECQKVERGPGAVGGLVD